MLVNKGKALIGLPKQEFDLFVRPSLYVRAEESATINSQVSDIICDSLDQIARSRSKTHRRALLKES